MTVSLFIGLLAVAAEAQGVETFLNTREALARMVPDADGYNFARITVTPEEEAAAKEQWNYELDASAQYVLFFGWTAEKTLKGVMYVGSHEGKHGPIKMAVGMDSAGTVKDLAVMQYQEVRGRPVRERAYLEQYVGKSVSDPIALGRDIRGLTGASHSSRAVTAAVKEAVVLFNIYVKQRGAATPPEE